VRERFVGPDEPEARPAPEIRREAQEKIVGSEGPGEQHVAEMPREVREGIAATEEPWGKHAAVIAELSRWLNNIGRLSSHAA
jgi:hypothetical protein